MATLDELIQELEESIPGITKKGKGNRDEDYVVSLCNEALGQVAKTQHTFPFLRGDTGMKLRVDAYYESLNLVIEYYESQHTERTDFFDNKKTVSGVSRGEQRRIYDQRRVTELPEHGIKLVIIRHTDFGSKKRLIRNHDRDLAIVKDILSKSGIATV